MAMSKLEALRDALAPGERLAGLDVGSKTIGVAVSDPGLMVASPVGTVRRRKIDADIQALRDILGDRRIGAFVIGLPVNMDGSEGPRAQSTRAFAENLMARGHLLYQPKRPVTVAFWDERWSTTAVTRAMVEEADMTRSRRARQVDQAAAGYILQGALDAVRGR